MREKLIQRVDRVEMASFLQLYGGAAAYGTGWHIEDGVASVWSRYDDDPSFSCVLNLAASDTPEETLAKLERVAAKRGATVIGVDTHPDLTWATDEQLRSLGYERDSEECIWALELDSSFEPEPPAPGVEISRATRSDFGLFSEVLNIGWDLDADASRGKVFSTGIGHEGWFHYIARVDGEVAGIAVLFVHDGVADCFLSATLPEFRGRGVQTALIEQRLADGVRTGCDVATSQTVVSNASPRNFARRQFQPLYRRWIYGKRVGQA